MAVSEHRSHSPDRHIENVHFNEAEGQDGFVIREGKDVVNIFPSRSSQRATSSKLKFRNFVDYSWDYDHGNGRLISTHYSGKFIAYVVKVQGVGAIRIVDLETNERGLMKGHRGLIKDLEFMHKAEDLIIGFVDDIGTVCVHKITKELKSNKLLTSLMMQINLGPNASNARSELRRFMWCKYVPDDSVDPGSPRDCAYNFAVCQNDVVYVANLAQLIQRFGEGVHTLSDFKGFFMTIDSHSGTVMDASFAPDGTALATASKDGTVKFFQVYMIGVETPRCLYSWSPHDGRAVGKIFFLDDHNVRSAADSQYWKYMLTATENMSEVKLWTCKTWQCLQHIKFVAPSPTQLRMDMDISAHYLIMGDVHRKVMFVLHLSHDDESARFDWISEFSLPASMLSFNVNSARPFNGTVRTHEDLNLLNAPDYKPASTGEANQTLLEVYFVQSKSLQQGTVIFQTPEAVSRSNGHNRISFNEAVTVKETGISSDRDDGGMEEPNQVDDDIVSQDNGQGTLEREITPTKSITIMNKQKSRTPSPHQRVPSRVDKMTEELSTLIGLPVTGSRGKRSPSTSRSPDILGLVTSPKSAQSNNIGRIPSPLTSPIARAMSTPGDVTKTSSSSSPSREVEEILSPKINNDLIGHRSATSQSMEGVMKHTPLAEFTHEENNHVSPHALASMHHAFMHSPTNNEVLASEVAQQLPQVLGQVSSIMEMMKAQAIEMKELKREINWLHNSQSNSKRNEDENVTKTLDKYFTHSQSQIQRLEESMKTLEILERQRIPQNNNPLPSNLAEVLATSIGQVVKTEIETTVLPNMLSLFEPTRSQIKSEGEKMIAAAENRMKQEIKQIVQNDAFKTSLTLEVSSNVRPIFENVLTELLRSSVIPSFEKALQNMYVQINDAFMKGTREYLSGLQVSLEQMKSQDKTEETLNNQFTSMQDNLTSVLQVELESQMLRVIQSLQGGVVKQIEEIMSKELTKAFRDQQRFIETSVVPRSSTPALSVCSENFGLSQDPIQLQKQLTAMVNMGDITGAFTQAASQGNLTLLMYLCNKVPPNQVFTKKLPLQTHLSIIQQMATEICGHTETKLNYLQAAVGALDLSDRRVLQSIARIVPIFQASIKKFIALNPDSKLSTNFKLLEMALCGIGGRYQQSSPNDVGQQASSALFSFGPGIIKHET